jgi:hypothetical protein
MTIRVRHTVHAFISEDTEGQQPLHGRQDPGQELQVADEFQRSCGGRIEVAAAGTENVPFGDVQDVRGVWVVMSDSFYVAFNGSADEVHVRRANAKTGTKARFFIEGDVTSVAIRNANAAAITGKYLVWGDPTA